jgi:Xaa-Pro aminopeptidase
VSGARPSGPEARLQALGQTLAERELDALLVESASDLRYLTGFTGSNGLAVVRRAGGGPSLFLTDFRYETQSAAQLPADAFSREIVTGGELLDALGGVLDGASGRLGFDDRALSVARHRRLGELLDGSWELVPAPGVVDALRVVKEPGEIERMRAAAQLADEALRELLEAGLVGRTEREVALELELRMRRLGADGPSFPTIVAAGPHAALPHAEPRAQEIPPDVLVTIDWGALHEGYCSDCTRTYATGEGISDDAREVYELVLSAQQRALDAVRAGPNGRELDAVARETIEQAGHGAHFGHGLGHGVGIDIHEPPRLARTAPEDPLQAGMIVTVEPGVYIPGSLGVRIEDLVVVRESGHELLTSLAKELLVVS